MATYRIAAIGGDGIGPEVIAAGLEVLHTLADGSGFGVDVEQLPWSSAYYQQHGHYIPPDGLQRLKQFDAILFGAVGSTEVPDHVSLWGLRLPICQGFDQYANVRPARLLPGVSSRLSGA
ncbi:MAG TPA: isocitrate/isopropylmalate family dehydrogenase, partial [Burkholderiaceae bacterium]|nr:isocitrate/isopropylmalate family dehydrogenase [Burkholderiaceae bacterium]